jgi:hypothetical protein
VPLERSVEKRLTRLRIRQWDGFGLTFAWLSWLSAPRFWDGLWLGEGLRHRFCFALAWLTGLAAPWLRLGNGDRFRLAFTGLAGFATPWFWCWNGFTLARLTCGELAIVVEMKIDGSTWLSASRGSADRSGQDDNGKELHMDGLR